MSQVNFFMTHEDEDTFFDFLFSREDTHVLSGRFFDSGDPAPLTTKKGIGKDSCLTLVNKVIMPQPKVGNHGGGAFTGQYLFDLFRDPTIELSRSRISKKRMLNGRIYAKIGWLKPKEANAVYKSWYGSIERWLKKHYRRVDKTWWFGPGAWEWSMAGGVCCFGDELAFAASLANVDRDWIDS
jgi:hypothetical protein